MAFGAETAKLVVDLSLAGNFTRQIGASQRALKSFDSQLSKTEGRAFKAGQQIGTGIQNAAKLAAVGIGLLASQTLFGLKQLAELEKLGAQTAAVIKSTGGAAGVSADEVRKLAEEFENVNAIIDDKVIQSGENLLLTFTNIGKKAFKPTLQAALDMSTALGQDLNTSVLQLGKALSDPAKGLLALRRAGVIFSKDQEKRIKQLQKEGKLWEAQQLILQEVGREFGGSFAAQGGTAEAAIAGIGDAVEDLQKDLATALFPTIQKVLPKLRSFLQSPELIAGVDKLGKGIAGLFSDENIAAGVDILKSVFNTAKAAAPVVSAAAKTMAGIVSTAVNVFKSLPPEIQQLAIGAFAVNKLTGGLITNVAGAAAGGIAQFLANQFKGVMNVNAGVVNVSGGVGGTPGAGPGGSALGAIGAAGSGLAIVGALQAAMAGLAGQIAGPIAEAVQKNVGGGPINVFGPFDRLFRALSGDLRSPLEMIEGNTAKVNDTLRGGIGAIAKNTGDEAREAARIKAEAAVHSAAEIGATNKLTSTAQSQLGGVINQVAAAKASQVSADAAIKAATDRAAVASRAAGQQAAAAIRDKDLSVTTNVKVDTTVSIRETIKQTTRYKTIYRTAS